MYRLYWTQTLLLSLNFVLISCQQSDLLTSYVWEVNTQKLIQQSFLEYKAKNIRSRQEQYQERKTIAQFRNSEKLCNALLLNIYN